MLQNTLAIYTKGFKCELSGLTFSLFLAFKYRFSAIYIKIYIRWD